MKILSFQNQCFQIFFKFWAGFYLTLSVCSLIMPSHTSSALCWKKRNTFHYAYEALHKKSVHSCTLYLNAIGEIIFLKERKKNYVKTPCAGWCSYPLIQPGANGSIDCWVRACVCVCTVWETYLPVQHFAPYGFHPLGTHTIPPLP